DHPAQGSALPRRVVGASAEQYPALGGGRGAGADRHARSRQRARGSGLERPARRALGGTASPGRRAPPSARTGRSIVSPPRAQLAEELLRRLSAALRSRQLYSKNHPIIARNLE